MPGRRARIAGSSDSSTVMCRVEESFSRCRTWRSSPGQLIFYVTSLVLKNTNQCLCFIVPIQHSKHSKSTVNNQEILGHLADSAGRAYDS